MLNSEDAAKRLVPDPSSWSQGGIKRKAYRSMSLTPDEEVPRHRAFRKNKKKHVHKWGPWIMEGTYMKPVWGKKYRITYVEEKKYVRICKKCGTREKNPRWHW
jgi:hypothetical protein